MEYCKSALFGQLSESFCGRTSLREYCLFKGMEHVPNMFMSFDKYLFIEVINILI